MSKNKLIIFLLAIYPLVIGIACMSSLSSSSTTDQEPVTQEDLTDLEEPLETLGDEAIDPENLQEALTGEVVDNRLEVYAYLGRPDAFDIAIVEVEGSLVRMESWRYYQYGVQVDFADGSALWVVEIEPMPEGTIFAAWYDPVDFLDVVTGSEAIEVATITSPTQMVPTVIDFSEGGDPFAGGTALVGDQIVIGLVEDQVVYVETIAFVPEGGDQ